ncbi:MAG: hypothetical protein Q8K81_09630 [Sulfuricurvum sp.]|nr:hypothetical protein [Sulfuricurvum sp.]
MQEERKQIIRYALDFNIVDINTYSGYKGDLIVKINTKEKDVVIALRKFALSLGIKEVVIKQNNDLVQYEIFCVTRDEGAYHIKADKLIEYNSPTKRTKKDIWEVGQFLR